MRSALFRTSMIFLFPGMLWILASVPLHLQPNGSLASNISKIIFKNLKEEQIFLHLMILANYSTQQQIFSYFYAQLHFYTPLHLIV